jgi:hypothetical protein
VHPTIVDRFGPHLARAVGAEGEHDGVDTVHRARECLGPGDVTDQDLRFLRKPTMTRYSRKACAAIIDASWKELVVVPSRAFVGSHEFRT